MMNSNQSVYIFNPTSDYAIANGDENWNANKLLQKMERDLSTLPIYFAEKNDFVIADSPSASFLKQLSVVGIEIPNFVSKNELKTNELLLRTKDLKLLPWGWSPAMHKLLQALKPNCCKLFCSSPVFNWEKKHKQFYSKVYAQTILYKIHQSFWHQNFIEKQYLPKVCTAQSEIELLLEKWGKLMIKAPWSSSGRGLQPITKKPVHEKVWEKIGGIINEQGAVVVEPYLNKVFDLAFQFEIKKGKVKYLGPSYFLTDRKGQYIGNFLNEVPHKGREKTLDFVYRNSDYVIQTIINAIEQSELSENYEGFFGVDTLVFLDNQNQLKINPCLEINLRMNMGLLSLQFGKLINNNKPGLFKMYYNPKKSYFEFKLEMEKQFPLQLKNKRIEAGFFSLTDATKQTEFGAYIIV